MSETHHCRKCMTEDNVREELLNIVQNWPLFAGDTISHDTAYECVRRGWAFRDSDAKFVPTPLGRARHRSLRFRLRRLYLWARLRVRVLLGLSR